VSIDVRRADHTGFTVSDLETALRLWRDALGFTVLRRFELTGDFAAALSGQPGAHSRHAIVHAHGQRVELIEYLSPVPTARYRPRPCDVGSVHLGLIVADMGAALAELSAAGCTPVGDPRPIPDGARKGSLFAYVHDPDGVTLELIELAPGTE